VVTVFISYLLNSRFVFSQAGKEKPNFWKSLFKVYLSYIVTGLIIIPLLTFLQEDVLGFPHYLATIINIPISVPINFLLNKYFAYRNIRKESQMHKTY
jgi:putative flippase GtrA